MVNPLTIASLSFQTPATQAGKMLKEQKGTGETTEDTAFSMLFGSLSAPADLSVNEESADTQLDELTKALTETVTALEEFTAQALEAEEEMTGAAEALLQTLSLLLKKLEDQPVGKELPQPLLRQFAEQLQTVAAMEKNTKMGEAPPTEMPLPLSDAKDVEQALKQLAVMVEQDDTHKQTTGRQQLVQKLEELEQVLKQWGTAEKATDGQKQTTPPPDAQPATRHASEAFRQLPGTPVEVNNTQVLPASSAESSVKAEPLPSRSEPAPPTPTVRMANLTEELGEVLRGSFRLNGTGESTQQIRVNITPDHLGHLDIRLTFVNGKMAAQIITSNFAAKEVLELQVNQLRASLLQQGVTVDKIEITQQNPQQSFGQQQASPEQRFAQQQKQGNHSHKNGYQQFEEEAPATVDADSSANGKMKVDYTI